MSLNLVSTSYTFASAYLKGKEAKGLRDDHMDGIFQKATTIPEVIDFIRDTDIGDYLGAQQIRNYHEADRYLWTYLDRATTYLKKFRIPRDMERLLALYLEKYDVLNVKSVLRKLLRESDTPPLTPLGTIHARGLLAALTDAASPEDAANVLEKCGLGMYGAIVRDIKENDARATYEGEFGLDVLYHKRMAREIGALVDGDILAAAFAVMIDCINLKTLLRTVVAGGEGAPAAAFIEGGHMLFREDLNDLLSQKPADVAARLEHTEYAPLIQEIIKSYAKENSPAVIDRILDRHRLRLLGHLLSPRSMSPCTLLWYLICREQEIRNLRLIMKTVADGIPPSEVRDFVVIAA